MLIVPAETKSYQPTPDSMEGSGNVSAQLLQRLQLKLQQLQRGTPYLSPGAVAQKIERLSAQIDILTLRQSLENGEITFDSLELRDLDPTKQLF